MKKRNRILNGISKKQSYLLLVSGAIIQAAYASWYVYAFESLEWFYILIFPFLLILFFGLSAALGCEAESDRKRGYEKRANESAAEGTWAGITGIILISAPIIGIIMSIAGIIQLRRLKK